MKRSLIKVVNLHKFKTTLFPVNCNGHWTFSVRIKPLLVATKQTLVVLGKSVNILHARRLGSEKRVLIEHDH